MKIDDEPHAMRLARAILSDVGLYNDDAIKGASISVRRAIGREIEEGRQLYNARVTEPWLGVFDRELVAWVGRVRPDLADEPDYVVPSEPQPPKGEEPGFVPQGEPRPRSAEEMFARERERSITDPRSGSYMLPVVIAILSLLAATAAWWYLRQ